MTLQPQVIHPKGDIFFNRRLPEFKSSWKDEEGRRHPLRIIGRHLSCEIHDAPILSGFIPFRGSGGDYDLACLELRSHWPRIFQAGDEFLDLHSEYRSTMSRQEKFLGRLQIEKTAVNQARTHVLASMIDALANSVFGDCSYLSRASAAALLEYNPEVGSSKSPDGTDANVKQLRGLHRQQTWGYSYSAFMSKMNNWSVPADWYVSVESESPSIAI